MNTYDYIKRRVSIRKFNDQKVEEETVNKIIEASIHAPTAGNMMPYTILKVTDRDMLKTLSESCDNQPFIATADFALVYLVDLSKWHRYFKINGVDEYAKRTGRTYDGPTLADAILGINDALIASESSVIAAESFGVGSCYIGDILEKFEFHRELFKLPEYVFPATMLVFGNYDNQPQPRSRFEKEFVVFENTYKDLTDDDINKMYEERTKLYNPGISPEIQNYAQQFYNRKIGSDFFEEMNRSLKEMFKIF